MTTVPTYTQADEYHLVRQTKEWIDLGDSIKVAVQKQKTAALTKALDYITSTYPIMVGDDADIQAYIDARVQTACIMLAPFYSKQADTLVSTPEVLEKELQSGDDKIKTKYAVSTEGFWKQERFPLIKSYIEPVLANAGMVKVVR